ncbi:MAG TPA: VCBS repeat-containing protein [Planctomycetota bacterium]|nr:VCBS repeat-containing protein [Planctomycetota bacterium]
MTPRRIVAVLALGILVWAAPALAYIEAPYSLGRIITESSNIMVIQVDKVNKQNNMILYKKIRDIKGQHPGDVIRHNIAQAGFHPREWQTVMAWAEPGKLALMFYNGGASETCIDTYWYQCYGAGPDWGMSHGEPFLLRSYAGKVEKLAMAVEEILANREVIVPAMVDGDKNLLHVRSAKVQRLRASLKLVDYNPARDFIGWGSEDFRRISTMPGFSHLAALGRVDPDARGIAPADFDGDGATDLLLYGEKKVILVKVDGGALNEIALPYTGGARAAAWADWNGDGKPDLLLATPTGPKLLTNLGKNAFRDDSALLPKEPYYDVTAAAWIDYDGDGKPDILLANGFLGLRLYRNPGGEAPVAPKAPKYGPWWFIGGFDNTGGQGFDKVYPPEQGIDLGAKYPGKGNAKIGWQEGKFTDGQVQSFLPLVPAPLQTDSVAYLYREIDAETAAEIPASFGSDDTLTVWMNGKKLISENVARGAAPDQSLAKLSIKPGKNKLLLKICQGQGDWGFYFAAKEPEPAAAGGKAFEDVTDKVRLGPDGVAGHFKGDHLLVADFAGDGRQSILYSAGDGVFIRNTPSGFTEDHGFTVRYQTGGVAPALGDYLGSGKPGIFIPQPGGGKLYRNDGNWKFTDVTAESGDLAKFTGHATSAVWVDLFKKGKPDLIVACLGSPNRYFRNMGGGKFKDASHEIGLDRRILNSRAVAVGDVNKDGVLDVIFNNEGQDPFILLGDPTR